jgi:hypothetical protein
LGVAGARIDVASIDGKSLTSVETNSDGEYRVTLPAGSYTITMASLHGAMFTKDLPATVAIGHGETKRLDIHLDTGFADPSFEQQT